MDIVNITLLARQADLLHTANMNLAVLERRHPRRAEPQGVGPLAIRPAPVGPRQTAGANTNAPRWLAAAPARVRYTTGNSGGSQ